MLFELLSILRQGGVHAYPVLAEKLGISEVLLEGMLEDLERLGYLRQVGGSCAGGGASHCAACPMAGTCAISSKGRIWALTEKGTRAAG